MLGRTLGLINSMSRTCSNAATAVLSQHLQGTRLPPGARQHDRQFSRQLHQAVAAYSRGRSGDRYASMRCQDPPRDQLPPAADHPGTELPAGSGASSSSDLTQGLSRTSGSSSRRSSGAEWTALGSRQWLMTTLPFDIHRAVGVSFEGRQDAIAHLHRRECCI